MNFDCRFGRCVGVAKTRLDHISRLCNLFAMNDVHKVVNVEAYQCLKLECEFTPVKRACDFEFKNKIMKEIEDQIIVMQNNVHNVHIEILENMDWTSIESVHHWRERLFKINGKTEAEMSLLLSLRQWLTHLLSVLQGQTPVNYKPLGETIIPSEDQSLNALQEDKETPIVVKIETCDFSMQTDEVPVPFVQADFDEVFKEYGMDINQDSFKPAAEPEMGNFQAMCAKLTSKKNKIVTVDMWHSSCEGMPNVNKYVPSYRYPNEKWHIVKTETGFNCTRIPVRTVHPEMGGVSNSLDHAYGSDEERPAKQLLLANFMNIKMLTFVDMELYAELKGFVLESGVVPSTHATLHKKATAFLRKYRIDHLDAIILLEVRAWTVYAAMMATESELKGLHLMAKGNVIRDMGRVAEFKRTGTVTTSWLNGFSLRTPLFFGTKKKMYKPAE